MMSECMVCQKPTASHMLMHMPITNLVNDRGGQAPAIIYRCRACHDRHLDDMNRYWLLDRKGVPKRRIEWFAEDARA